MRVRNAKDCAVGLQRFAKSSEGALLVSEIESVSIAPGETADVDEDFLASPGAKEFLADGTLVDVAAERRAVIDSEPTAEPESPAKRSKSKGG